jgi:hypothetical protein
MLIPRWTFFAPTPGVTDFHLSYRTVAADGTVSEWEDIDRIASRTLVSAFWNPQKRVTKAVIEVVAFLTPLCREGLDKVYASPPYRCLVNHVIRATEESGRDHEFCEFQLAETTRSRDVVPGRFFFRSGLIGVGDES